LTLTFDGDAIKPGDVIRAETSMMVRDAEVPRERDITVSWELSDTAGNLFLPGSPATHSLRDSARGAVINAMAVIQIPDTVPVGETLWLTWFAEWDDRTIQATEDVPIADSAFGDPRLENAVVMGDVIRLTAVVDLTGVAEEDRGLGVELHTPDEYQFMSETIDPRQVQFDKGMYQHDFSVANLWLLTDGHNERFVRDPIFNPNANSYTTADDPTVRAYSVEMSRQIKLLPSLDPWVAQWTQAGFTIGTSLVWAINPSIASAMHEMRTTFERTFRYPGLLESALDDADYVSFLKMGRDRFNGVGHITDFDMTKADGTMRRMWLICATHEAATSRQLEEAVKAFDYSGQSTSLTVDLGQAYESFKGDSESQIQSYVEPFKRKLAVKGALRGDGSNESLRGRQALATGFTLSGVGTAGYSLSSRGSNYPRTRYITL